MPIARVPAVVCVATVIVDPLSVKLPRIVADPVSVCAAVRFKPAVAETSRVVPADMVMFGEASSGAPAATTSEPPLMFVSPSIEIVALLNVQSPAPSLRIIQGPVVVAPRTRLPVSSPWPAPRVAMCERRCCRCCC